MCLYPDQFESIMLCTGPVDSSSEETMTVKGKHTVELKFKLLDGFVTSFRMFDVILCSKFKDSAIFM